MKQKRIGIILAAVMFALSASQPVDVIQADEVGTSTSEVYVSIKKNEEQPSPKLPSTGMQVARISVYGTVFILVGLGIVLIAKRKKQEERDDDNA